MTSRTKDITGIVVGPLKVVEATDQRDSSKCTIWRAECTCGSHEYGSRATLEKFAGLDKCPGHPFKGHESPVEGFSLIPEILGTDTQKAALAAWEKARHGVSADASSAEPQGDTAGTPPAVAPTATTPKPNTGSEILRTRLGLDGYNSEVVNLKNTLVIQGGKVSKAIFAKAIQSDDRVLLHLELTRTDGGRSIFSALRKLTDEERDNLCAELAELQIAWRMREPKARAKKVKAAATVSE